MTLTWHLRPLLLSAQVGLLSAPGKLSWQRSNRFCESVPLNALVLTGLVTLSVVGNAETSERLMSFVCGRRSTSP